MSIEIKQKIKEVADDFGMPAKNLIEIVGKFYDKPKSSSQNLTEEQLNVILEEIDNIISSVDRSKAEGRAEARCTRTRTAAEPAGPEPAARAASAAESAPSAGKLQQQ